MTAAVVVLGGGAAGFFGAIRAAELGAKVILLEATGTPLQKVRISGGGRCNVTNSMTDPAQFVTRYPRGAKELRGVLSRFGSRETMAWFEAHGVALKTEPDGRVFPTTDDSETICACLEREAAKLGVEVRTHASIASASPGTDSRDDAMTRTEEEKASRHRVIAADFPALHLRLKDGSELPASALLLASGSNPAGLALARSLGHTVIPGVPSLFTFEVKDARLDGLAGVSVPRVRAKAIVAGKSFEQEGPLLVTHWGLSAHAVLRLSAWAAREFHEAKYQAELVVDFLPDVKDDAIRAAADDMRASHPRGTIGAHPLLNFIPRRLWERLVEAAGGDVEMRWAEVPKRGVNELVEQLKRARFQVSGKGPFKEEFVTAGGVARGEVDWRTMESKLVPGLYFAGEVLDVDALTGGFNLQNAWSTGWTAGEAMAARATATR